MIARFQRNASNVADLRTGRLRLVAITAEMLHAEQRRSAPALARLLGARLTPEWPPYDWEPHVFELILRQYNDHPETVGWHRYVVLAEAFGMSRTLVGAVGGFPRQWGDVEIGYSTLPRYQRRGIATAAAQSLVEWLLSRDGVRSVSAQTFLHLPASMKVMERAGMKYEGEGDEPSSVRYRRLRYPLPSPFLT